MFVCVSLHGAESPAAQRVNHDKKQSRHEQSLLVLLTEALAYWAPISWSYEQEESWTEMRHKDERRRRRKKEE